MDNVGRLKKTANEKTMDSVNCLLRGWHGLYEHQRELARTVRRLHSKHAVEHVRDGL